MNAVLHEADEVLLGFTRALRAAGVPVTQDRAHGFLAAVAAVTDSRRTHAAYAMSGPSSSVPLMAIPTRSRAAIGTHAWAAGRRRRGEGAGPHSSIRKRGGPDRGCRRSNQLKLKF